MLSIYCLQKKNDLKASYIYYHKSHKFELFTSAGPTFFGTLKCEQMWGLTLQPTKIDSRIQLPEWWLWIDSGKLNELVQLEFRVLQGPRKFWNLASYKPYEMGYSD